MLLANQRTQIQKKVNPIVRSTTVEGSLDVNAVIHAGGMIDMMQM